MPTYRTLRNLILLAGVILLSLAVHPVYAGGPVDATLPGQVETRQRANLRAGPGTNFVVVRVAAQGEPLSVQACNDACDWYAVGRDLWIAAFLVKPVTGPPATAIVPAAPAKAPKTITDTAPEAAPETATEATADELDELAAVEIEVTGAISLEPITAAVESQVETTVEAKVEATVVTGVTVVAPGASRVRFNTRIYQGPGTNHRIARTALAGEVIYVMGRNSLGNWYVLSSGDWIFAAAVLNPPSDLPIAWEPPPPPGGHERPAPPPPPKKDPPAEPAAHIQESEPVVAAASHPMPAAVPADCVDINTASFEELRRIDYIDEERAGQILNLRNMRPFASVHEMTRLSGIADVLLGRILEQGLACVR